MSYSTVRAHSSSISTTTVCGLSFNKSVTSSSTNTTYSSNCVCVCVYILECVMCAGGSRIYPLVCYSCGRHFCLMRSRKALPSITIYQLSLCVRVCCVCVCVMGHLTPPLTPLQVIMNSSAVSTNSQWRQSTKRVFCILNGQGCACDYYRIVYIIWIQYNKELWDQSIGGWYWTPNKWHGSPKANQI